MISADHGEAFGEHGMYKHAFELWEVLTRVPLLVCGPGIKAQRVTERRSHIDLVPTFLDLLGQKARPELLGKSLVPELTGQETGQEPRADLPGANGGQPQSAAPRCHPRGLQADLERPRRQVPALQPEARPG